MRKYSAEELVALENINNHQIGGERDGITPEVAHDLGFGTTLAVRSLRHASPGQGSNNTNSELNESDQENLNERIKIDVRSIKKRPHICATDAFSGELIMSIELGERGASPEQYDYLRRRAGTILAKKGVL